ncbi:MAG: hypothetical protein WC364_14185 [Eubacteriales bacterium]|jgi:glycosyltransferase involved in cell wall biosynthesis
MGLKVNWLSYLDPQVYMGGGERVGRELLVEAVRRGHVVRISSVRWGKFSRLAGPRIQLHSSPDVWILTDIWNCPEQKQHFPQAILDVVLKSRRYVTLDNAWTTICCYPLFPCNGDVSMCSYSCIRFRAREVYLGARAQFFVSRLHRKLIEKTIGIYLQSAIEMPPTVDKTFFHNFGVKRDIPFLFVGTIVDYKGAIEVERRFGNIGLHWVGRNVTGRRLKGVHLGILNNFQLRDVYNRSQYFVHLPEWNEPMGRSVIEALLCGCQVILNEKVGAVGWGTTEDEIRALPNGATVFWDSIEHC